jgi:spore coat protein A, manganese oxidase
VKNTRRNFIELGLAAGAGLALPLGALQIPLAREGVAQAVTSPSVEPFRIPLPVRRPVRSDADTDYFEMTLKEAKAELLPDPAAPVWGCNGMFPGPAVDAGAGRRVVIHQHNELPVPVSTHRRGVTS